MTSGGFHDFDWEMRRWRRDNPTGGWPEGTGLVIFSATTIAVLIVLTLVKVL